MDSCLVASHKRGFPTTTCQCRLAHGRFLKRSLAPYRLVSHRMCRLCWEEWIADWIQSRLALSICNDLWGYFPLWYLDAQCPVRVGMRWLGRGSEGIFLLLPRWADVMISRADNCRGNLLHRIPEREIFRLVPQPPRLSERLSDDWVLPKSLFTFPDFSADYAHLNAFSGSILWQLFLQSLYLFPSEQHRRLLCLIHQKSHTRLLLPAPWFILLQC